MQMQGKEVRLDQVSIRFGSTVAVEPTELNIRAGEFFSILGPSGCGKTTLLRVIAGFQPPTTGRVLIGEQDVTRLGANRRPTAMIFQSLALFPHMTVWENVAFGLEARRLGRKQRRQRAEELLALVALSEHADKRPTELSGGQRQRVAIARALAVDPAVLLLDEPLSALDLKLRQHMRAELKAIQRRTGVTFLYITHDQGEALAMSDRIAVMSRGRIEQTDVPDTLYAAPRSAFVATFLGEQNRVAGTVVSVDNGQALVDTALGPLRGRASPGLAPGGRAELMVRPERLATSRAAAPNGDANTVEAVLASRMLEGAFEHLTFDARGQSLAVQRLNIADGFSEGTYTLAFAPCDAVIFATEQSTPRAAEASA